MTVICETCQTANRDKAMFCIGCAGKMPAFAATGPAALSMPEARRRQRGDGSGGGKSATSARQDNSRRLHWWFVAVLLLGGGAAALIGWIALTPERTSVGASMPPTTSTQSTLPTPTPAAAPAVTRTTDAVPFESALSPGESPVAPPTAPPDNVQAPAQRSSPNRAQTSRASGSGRADPRAGCEHLFFAFAARCEANHCAEAAYARHPRCDVVRAERQRDDARRNMTSGY